MKLEAMSVLGRLRSGVHSLRQLLNAGNSERQGSKRVLVIEPVGEGEWKAVEADVSGECIAILRVGVVDKAGRFSGDGDSVDLAQLANGSTAILVTNSHKTVCRSLDLVNASPDETRRMVALRLETELPYPVGESAWVFDRQQVNGGDAGPTLVLATTAAEVAQAEERLRARGIRCGGVEFGVAGLAQLAATCHSDDTLATVDIRGNEVTFAIIHGGFLRYVRHLAANHSQTETAWAEQVARELNQSIYDYVLRANNGKPARVVVVGEGAGDAALLEAFRSALGIPVEPAYQPDYIAGPEGEATNGVLLERCPACLGVLIALHRRMRGERTTAPALRARRAGFEGIDLSGKRSVLALVVAGLFLVWVASLFGVRAARFNAAEHVVEESRASLDQIERIQDEVDILQYESRRQRSTLDALLALSEALPSEIKIEKFTIDPKGTVTIRGTVGSVEIASQKAIAALEQSPAFARPKFMGASEGKNGFTFGITCEFRGGVVAKPESAKTSGSEKKEDAGKESEAKAADDKDQKTGDAAKAADADEKEGETKEATEDVKEDGGEKKVEDGSKQ